MDLLADAEDLEVKPDPRNPQSYVCAGLQRVPISGLAGYLAMGQNRWYHFGVGAPPILVYSGDWDVCWGYGVLTHGQFVPAEDMACCPFG